MWAKVDDRLAHHAKIALAGRLLGGRDGGAVALGIATWGLLYCAENLTDGFIPDEAIAACPLSKRAREVAEALAKAISKPNGRGLWIRVDGGWQINDYHHYNRRADEVRAQREKDRQRKEIERRTKLGLGPVSEGCPDGQGPDSAAEDEPPSEGCPDGQIDLSEGCPSPRARATRPRGHRAVSVPSRPVPSDHEEKSGAAGAAPLAHPVDNSDGGPPGQDDDVTDDDLPPARSRADTNLTTRQVEAIIRRERIPMTSDWADDAEAVKRKIPPGATYDPQTITAAIESMRFKQHAGVGRAP
jgi:hypothetical protein